MRLVQLQTRWLEDDAEQWTVVAESTSLATLRTNRAPFGDFLDEYLKHRSIPWWRRLTWNPEWDVVEKLMRRVLNEHAAIVWIERKAS